MASIYYIHLLTVLNVTQLQWFILKFDTTICIGTIMNILNPFTDLIKCRLTSLIFRNYML